MDDMETLDKDEYMTCSSINMVCFLTLLLVCKTLKEEQKMYVTEGPINGSVSCFLS